MTANHLWSLRMLAAAGVLAPAGCQILVDLRGNCESDPDCRRDEQCVSNRCVPRDGGAGRLAFAAAPATAAAGECSSPLRLETRDGSDNPLPMSEPTSVQIAATPPDGVAFYTDPGCTSPLTSVILAIGTSEATFHAAISRAGRVTIEASSAGFQSASHGMDVAPGAPARLGFAAASPTVTVGACSPEVSVEILDKFGNPTRAAWPTAVNLATTSARGKFFADASCTVETNAVVVDAGTQQASVRYRDLAIGTPTLTASASELGSARQVIGVVGTGTPTTLVFATPLRTVTAGDCSGVVTVSTQDSLGNATAASSEIAVSLTSTSPDTTFHTDVSCAQSSTGVIIAAGADTANFYFKDTRAGTPTLTASATGLTSATQIGRAHV